MLGKPGLGYRQKQLVTFGIEVGCVLVALEVFLAECFVANTNDVVWSVVPQYGDAVLLTDLFDDTAYRLKTGLIHIPRCYIADMCLGVMLLNTA